MGLELTVSEKYNKNVLLGGKCRYFVQSEDSKCLNERLVNI